MHGIVVRPRLTDCGCRGMVVSHTKDAIRVSEGMGRMRVNLATYGVDSFTLALTADATPPYRELVGKISGAEPPERYRQGFAT